MTAIGWLQITLFFLLILAVTKPLGHLPLPGLRGAQPSRCPGCSGPWSACCSRLCGVDPRARADAGCNTRCRCWPSACFGVLLTYALQRLQHLLPLNPQGFGGGGPGAGLQHGGQLHDQHQLAVLRGRVDDVATSPRWRGWPCTTSSPRRRASASRWRSRAGFTRRRGPRGRDAGQLLGGPRPRHPLRAAAPLRRLRAVPGVARACSRTSRPTWS